jgi:hypothetical protein
MSAKTDKPVDVRVAVRQALCVATEATAPLRVPAGPAGLAAVCALMVVVVILILPL